MYKCPNCGKKSISGWEKLRVRFFRTITCNECGTKLGTSYYFFLFVPFIIAIDFLLRYVGLPILWVIVIIIVETLILSLIYIKYIPLVPRQSTEDL